jgi:hypothetical protein
MGEDWRRKGQDPGCTGVAEARGKKGRGGESRRDPCATQNKHQVDK